MALEQFVFEVVGTSPLLMNNPAKMAAPSSGGPKVKRIPSPEEEAKGLLYVDKDGQLYGPAMGFKSALASAGKQRKIGKYFVTALVKGNIFCPIEVERVTLLNPKTRKPLTEKDYTIDSRRAVLGQGKKRVGVVRSRPRIESWACDVVLEIETELLNINDVLDLFAIAGRSVGYLDFRPENGGPFGRFTAKLKK